MHKPILRTLTVSVALALGSGWAAAQSTGGTSGSSTQTSSTPSAKADAGTKEKLSHADKEFIEDAAKGGMFEVQSGKLAEQKAKDEAVKSFAQRIVQDHTKANDELQQIAQAKGVKMPDKEKWMQRHEMSKLQKLTGADFDREYAQHSVKDHEKDIKDFEKAASKVKDPDLKAWAEKQLPVLREHLAMAQKLPEANGKQSAANSANGMAKRSSS
jgi:putative membrane protein